MAKDKYSPTTNPGEKRTRTKHIDIFIPNQQTPFLKTIEEDVIADDSLAEITIKEYSGLNVEISNMLNSFPLRNPGDDSLLGSSATVQEAFVLIYSYIRQMQLDRDARVAADQAAAVAFQIQLEAQRIAEEAARIEALEANARMAQAVGEQAPPDVPPEE